MAVGDKKSVLMAADKGVPGGVATLNSSGKLVQMPTASDTGAVSKAGDTMTGLLRINIGGQSVVVAVREDATFAYLQYSDPEKQVAANLGFSDKELFYQTTKDTVKWDRFNIYHSGNLEALRDALKAIWDK